MPESSDLSGPNTANQDYISKRVAIALLQELLEQQEIDKDLKKQVLKKIRKNLKTHSENIDLVQNPPINVKVILSIRGIEIEVPEGVEVEFIEEKTDVAKKMKPEFWAEARELVDRIEVESSTESSRHRRQMATVTKCENPKDRTNPICQKISEQAIESVIIMK